MEPADPAEQERIQRSEIYQADPQHFEERAANARADVNCFIPLVVKDEEGRKFQQAAIHQTWHDHIAHARSIGKHACIIALWGHGKTAQLVIGRTLWELGRNPNLRIKIVCNDDPSAMKRVLAIRKYIESDDDYHAVFPAVRPGRRDMWTQHCIYVQRSQGARSIDPSIEAHGILGTGIGGRCDGLIFDDPVDLRNAIEVPALKPKVIDAFKNTWMSRLEPHGWMLYVATRWTEDDLTATILNDPELSQGYSFLIQAVSEDYTQIVCQRIE